MAGVAQIFNLRYRRIEFGRRSTNPTRGGFQIRDTAEFNSALRVPAFAPDKTEALRFKMDPAKLSKASLVAEASAAIQKAAQSGGIQLGPIRESPARSSAKELTSMQLEGVGQVPAVMGLLHRLESLGYPLILESVQINPDATKPGMVKLSLTVVILDYEQWKIEKVTPNA